MVRQAQLAPIVLLAALTLAAQANAQAVTDCSQFGSSVTCRTTADPMAQMQQQQQQLSAFMADQGRASPDAATAYSWRDVPPTKCSGMEKVGLPFGLCAAREVAATRKGVGDLVGAGKCDEALKAALGTGDFAFARDVRDFCAGH